MNYGVTAVCAPPSNDHRRCCGFGADGTPCACYCHRGGVVKARWREALIVELVTDLSRISPQRSSEHGDAPCTFCGEQVAFYPHDPRCVWLRAKELSGLQQHGPDQSKMPAVDAEALAAYAKELDAVLVKHGLETLFAESTPAQNKRLCVWVSRDGGATYGTSCGRSFAPDGDLDGFHFCYACGGRLDIAVKP